MMEAMRHLGLHLEDKKKIMMEEIDKEAKKKIAAFEPGFYRGKYNRESGIVLIVNEKSVFFYPSPGSSSMIPICVEDLHNIEVGTFVADQFDRYAAAAMNTASDKPMYVTTTELEAAKIAAGLNVSDKRWQEFEKNLTTPMLLDEFSKLYKEFKAMDDAPSQDKVNPPHYKNHPSGVECITITRHMNFNLGNATKYIWRAGLKEGESGLDDLEKAIWYLKDEVERIRSKK